MLTNKNQAAQTNLSQSKDLKLEDFPIHTMQEDLAEITAPISFQENKGKEAESPLPKTTSFSQLNDVQKSSPFLAPLQKKESALPSFQTNAASPESSPEINHTTDAANEKQPERHERVMNIILFLLVLILFAGGGYYMLFIRNNGDYSSQIMQYIPGLNSASILSADKPNYLSIDTENLNKAQLQSTLHKYAEKVAELGSAAPIEFIVTDKNNNPVPFQEFASRTEINLGSTAMSNIQSEFSLFLYIDQGLRRAGVVLHSSNPDALKEAMIKEEATLAETLSPLFLSSESGNGQGNFGSSSYNNISIRYQNVVSPEELSIDYAITNGNLVIGTTKMTLRSILDHLQARL